ncbi:hypothetical protein RDI58_023647 [Solanum bulbocastanum]|uniref:Fe2OG dioxygenase domain-containing protein n=1 Tax=Solanum bulbocastanum TaxID=147425 RepID=A0AAN8SW97_SOLBU
METLRVQLLAEKGEISVPSQYVQPPETRPQIEKTNVKAAVPVIDLSSRTNLLDELKKACKEWGAFQVINHKVPISLLDDMRRVGRTFFEGFTMEEKLKYSCDSASPASEGYGSRMLVASNDTVLDWRDYFDHHTLPSSQYGDHMKALAQEILGLVSESLDLTCQCIENVVGEFYQNITISYYPPCPQPELTLGLQSHSDFGAITLLIQDDVGGLEVFNNGEWVSVNPISNAICVILADQTEVLQESMKELQANNKCMLSSICHVRSLLQEEMRLDSTSIDTPEILDDKTITSVLESACDDNDTEIADTVKSHWILNFPFLMLDIQYKRPFLPLFCSVLLLTLPSLNFLICPSQREIFLQNFFALIQLLVRLVYTFAIGLILGGLLGLALISHRYSCFLSWRQ